MDYWKNKIVFHRLILLILSTYFILHLLNLTLLPVFNDESGYLDWAWSYTHMPGHLYDSLLDAKQPLMVWIFAIFENFFEDPLFAGRFASALIGSASVAGIYIVAKKLLDKYSAFIAAMLYAIVPIFVFYNRQALLEAGISCIGIWTCYALLCVLHKPSTRNSVMLGIILGIGFFIKSSSLLFIASSTILIFLYAYKKRQLRLIKSYFISLTTFFCVDLLLFINPLFWEGLALNSRFSYTPSEFLTFPAKDWLDHFFGFIEIGLVFVTPFIFLSAIAGIVLMWKTKEKNHKIFIAFIVSAL